MRKRTRAWSFVAQEATRLAALGCPPSEIAQKTGVDKSTVTRWIAAGKLKVAAKVTPMNPVSPRQSPAEWAKAMRDEFALDSTDEQLVTLGEQALSLSRDMTAKASVQLTAGARFQAIVRQLALVTRREGEKEQTLPKAVNDSPTASGAKKNPPVRRRSNVDPRNILTAVK